MNTFIKEEEAEDVKDFPLFNHPNVDYYTINIARDESTGKRL